jgi:hypothetical protein
MIVKKGKELKAMEILNIMVNGKMGKKMESES